MQSWAGIRTPPLLTSVLLLLDITDPGSPQGTGVWSFWGEINSTNHKERKKDIAMNICYGPLEYLTAFALVLVVGILCGFALGWSYYGYCHGRSPCASHGG